jgi:hypothetical protein
MNTVLRRIGSAMSPVALLIAILALVVSAAGVGYAAGQIGTKQIKNKAITAKKLKDNAVTTPKIKAGAVTADKIPDGSLNSSKVQDGSLTAADLVPNEAQKVAALTNGGEGDCVWQGGSVLLAGLADPTYRKDRFGTVHLSGIFVGADGPGGDLTCNTGDPGEGEDAIVFMLPAGYVPAKTLIFGSLAEGVIVVGAQGLTEGAITLPPGAVASVVGDPIILDGVDFESAGSGVSIASVGASGQVSGKLLTQLLGR